MKLLFVTQVVDRNDAVLGAYHGWLIELAKHVESIEVICLYEGEHTLPSNVRVHSLGKECSARSALVYSLRFLSIVWGLRREYDAVFVHMNQEYILLAGWLWKFLGKRVYLWRNHYAGSLLTDIAAAFCVSVFCTSKYSYTAKYTKTVLMPVGVDTKRFGNGESVSRAPGSILFLARMSPSKRPDMLIEALGLLIEKGTSFTASFYGAPNKEDAVYYDNLRHQVERRGLHDRVRFYPSIPNERAARVFRTHDIFVNCSPPGMYDKTIFEAAASGCLVLAASGDFREVAGDMFHFTDVFTLFERLNVLLSLPVLEQERERDTMRILAEEESLPVLCGRLARALYS